MPDRITSPIFPELTFEELGHIYRLNGIEIPSVSNVMEPLTSAHYDGIDSFTLEKAAERGTTIHDSIEFYTKYGYRDIPREYEGYLNAFIDWYELTKPEVVGTELRVYHKNLWYGGTCDLLCYIDGKLTLVDYKSTSGASLATWGVQLEAYKQAFFSHGIEIEQKKILQIKKNGRYKGIEFPEPDADRWNVFLACLTLQGYKNKYMNKRK